MSRMPGILAMVVLSLSLHGCKQDSATVVGDPLTAKAVVYEMVYGTENDEVTSGTAVMNKTAGDTVPRAAVNDTVVFNGLVSGTATVVNNTTWTETGAGTPYNRTFTFSGSRSVTFANYSNVSGRATDGTVTVTIVGGTLQSSTGGQPVQPGTTVTRTATNVDKTVKGAVTLTRGVQAYACDIDLRVVVNSRVTDWTLDAALLPTNPVLRSRDVTVTGTVTVNGSAFAVNLTVNRTSPQ